MLRIGYPCMNLTVGCSTAGTVRLDNYTPDRFRDKLRSNLECLEKIFAFNAAEGILVYRVSSNLVPFASHAVQIVAWQEEFADIFKRLGSMAAASGIRLSTHPGQFVLINAPRPEIVAASVRELEYQVDMLELMETDTSAKVQIHVGGVYGDKEAALERFAIAYEQLPERVRSRLVIENDERLFTLEDCQTLSQQTGVPILFDAFHHQLNPGNLAMREAFEIARATWSTGDGPQQIDFSEQDPEKQLGAHSQSISPTGIESFLEEVGWPNPLDVMLEVKDKELSVKAIRTALGARVA